MNCKSVKELELTGMGDQLKIGRKGKEKLKMTSGCRIA